MLDKIRNSHEYIFKFFLAVCAIAALTYVFPKEGKFKFEFEKGEPWLHEKLYAPFGFSIEKSETQLQEEREAAVNRVKPYFTLRQDILAQALSGFEAGLDEKWENNPPKKPYLISTPSSKEKRKKILLSEGKKALGQVFGKGIIQQADVIQGKEPDFVVVVQEGKYAKEKELRQLLTLKTARQKLTQLIKSQVDSTSAQWLLPLLDDQVQHNILFDPSTTEKAEKDAVQSIPTSFGMVEKGATVIDKGDMVTDEKFMKLKSLKKEYETQLGRSSSSTVILFGQVLLISILVGLMLAFLYLFRKEVYLQNDKVLFLLLLIILDVYMAHISILIDGIHLYMLPFCVIPIVVRTFYDARLATFVHLISITIIGFIAPNGYEFMFIQIIAGLVAVYSLVSLRKRSQLFATSLQIFITYSATFIGLSAIQEGDLMAINYMQITWFMVSAGLTLFAYPLIYAFEKTFGFLSDVSLMELSDTNGELLRELASKAPGTFQHSLQVANLAEEAIREIGGNTMLVRTGALYHDIGKMESPLFFIENQSGHNPHNDLAPKESARIIIGHVLKGIELAKKHGLPEQILDFIRTHHGTTKTMFFLRTYKANHPDEELDESQFQYPGPLPFSKETAVLMMADSVEAASRSLKKPDEETIGNLVENIINGQANQEQFVNSDITYRDITTIKKIFKQKLVNIYHARIEYPKG